MNLLPMERNSPLWNYFWKEVDAEEKHEGEEIRTLRLLASLGYKDAYAALRRRLGENVIKNDINDDTTETMLDTDSGSTDTTTMSKFTGLVEAVPTIYDYKMDKGGFAQVDYLVPSSSAEREIIMSPSMSSEEEDSHSIEDVSCFAYCYGGPEVENTEGWDRIGLLPDPWAEERHPTVKMITSKDLTEEDIEPNLNMITMASGLGNLALTPDKQGYGYTKLQLASKGLQNIDLLKNYPYLQYVDLSNNQIEDLSPLWEITHLIVLDLSNNHLIDESILKPEQIWFLTYLNLSHNNFTQIPDFSNCWAIKHLDLSFNEIKQIEVVYNLKYLSYLNLSHNSLEIIENLNNKFLKEVDFSYNRIEHWRNPGPIANHSLETINISHNELQTLSIFSEMYTLTTLDISYNQISRMSDFDALKSLPVVTDLKIAGNKLNTIIPDSKRLIMYLMPAIKRLDGIQISAMERVSSISQYSHNLLQELIVQHSKSFFYHHTMNPTVGWERYKDTGEHPALIILIGNIGSQRRIIIDMVQKMNSHICKEVKMITSRPRVKNELLNNRMKYVSLKRFNEIEKEGGFLVIERRFGHKSGIAVTDLEVKHRVLIAFLGMTAALEVLWKGFNPTLIIMLPNKEEVLIERCLEWFEASDVYRPKFKVESKGKQGDIKLSNNKKNSHKDDDHSRDFAGNSLNGKQSKSQPLQRTEKAKLKKCHRMFTSVYSKNRKWKLKRYLGIEERRKVLDEPYGGLLSAGTGGMLQKSWCNIRHPAPSVQPSRGSFSSNHNTNIGGKERRKNCGDHEFRRFVQNIFQTQISYREMHIKNPGLFQSFISTDDLQKAAHRLLEVVESLYEKLVASKKVKTVNMQNDPYYGSMVHEPLMGLIDEMTAYDPPLDIVI